MLPLLLTAGLLAFWWLIGTALIAALGGETRSLRMTLVAPALGVAVLVLLAFASSQIGLAADDFAVPLVVALVVASVGVLAWRRPRVSLDAWPVLVVCGVATLLIGAPMFEFGFDWIANGNADMSNYVLGGERLLDRGIGAPLDVAGLLRGTEYAEGLKTFHETGARPGPDILLALLSGLTGLRTFQLFMPLILALHLAGACAAGGLALQASRKRWAAWIAATVVALAPLLTYAVLQQLIGQAFGLCLAVALAAVLMRENLHRGRGPALSDVVTIGVLTGALALAYVEMGGFIALGYALYLIVLALRRELELRACLRLWLPAAAVAAIVLGPYWLEILDFLTNQSGSGTSAGDPSTSLFGFMLVPSALPGVVGLQTLVPPPLLAPRLDLSIAVAALLLVGAAVVCLVEARRASAAGAIGTVMVAFAAFLAVRQADFGLFKLAMYAIPFVVAAVAAWMVRGGLWRLGAAGVPLVVAIVVGTSTQANYVDQSREPVSVPKASAEGLLPRFDDLFDEAQGRPVVTATDNLPLQRLEAATANGRPLIFLASDPVDTLLSPARTSDATRRAIERVDSSDSWRRRAFVLPGGVRNRFSENVAATRALDSGRCLLITPTPLSSPFNRARIPASEPLATPSCRSAHDVLLFVTSRLGQHYYLGARQRIAFFELENDPLRAGGKMSSFGRYALFRVLRPTRGARFMLDVSQSYAADGRNLLPRASVLGSRVNRLPLEGRGSGRVASAPLRPVEIAGVPYLMLDMGREGQSPRVQLDGLNDLYGVDGRVDNRRVTAHVRDASLVSAREYARLRPPALLDDLPADLADPRVEYSGIYEDGWVGDVSHVRLTATGRGRVVVTGDVPGTVTDQEIEVLVDGRSVARQALDGGAFEIRAPIAVRSGRRRVALRFTQLAPLSAADRRPASAHLTSVGFAATSQR